jgi:Zn-dependent protease
MNDSVRLGRVAGVRVGLNWTLVAMVVLVAVELARGRFTTEAAGYPGGAYAVAGMVTAIGLFVGVLLHELGHAVVARRVGLKVDGITLTWMGGVTRIEGDAPKPSAELIVAGIGPLVSAGFGGLLWLTRALAESLGAGRLVLAALGWLAAINVLLAVFNLLPAAPLDGGRVLHSVVWAATKNRYQATRAAAATGVGLGVLLMVAGFAELSRPTSSVNGLVLGVIGWWIFGTARAEMNVGAVHHALDGVRMADIMRPVGAAPGWITIRAFADGYATGRPGWVWLLEQWGGGYGGVLLGDAVGSVPLPEWDILRPIDVAVPISATSGAAPSDDALSVFAKTGGRHVILVVDQGRSVGAVLPADVEALVRMGGRSRVVPQTQAATRGWR